MLASAKPKGVRPPDPTNSARQKAYKARQKERGLVEIRGLYAPKVLHAQISEYAKSLEKPKIAP